MPPAIPPKGQSGQEDPDTTTRLGGWLFRHRTSIPLPIVLALLLIPPPRSSASLSTPLMLAGVLVAAAGELLRFVGVHHIGVISRTRSERLGPLDRHRAVLARPQPAVSRQHPALARLRDQRAAALARADRGRPARAGIPRDRAVGRAAARVADGRTVSRLQDARAALDSRIRRRPRPCDHRRPASPRRSRGRRRSTANAERSSRSSRATCCSGSKNRL